ncbi:MAG: subtilisin-like proprotein convertase family protein [Neolewinella sp.]|jgi:subtilisin-like proprotein convertase family protein
MYSSLRKGLIALAFFCCSGLLFAQYALTTEQLDKVPVERLPLQNNNDLLTAEMEARAPGRANRFAVPISTKIRPTTHGSWSEEGTNSIWRMRISSPGAKTLNLGFSEYNLPAGAELSLVTEAEHLGPFTVADNEEHNQLWTPLIDGDALMLELRVPTASKKRVQLYLTFVNHDFIDARKAFSGACNLDVICSQADGWGIVDGYRDIIRSVAAFTISGTDVCTGFLVNNVNGDGKPLFMTANHCGVTSGRAPALVAYWNFESPTCRQPNSGASGGNGGGQRSTFNSGATWLASYAPSDVTIIELDDPINPSSNAFFAGWSAEAEVPSDTMIAIHHPGVDEKRISFSFQDPYRAAYFGAPNPNADHLEIPDWDIGTTEGGSSGSPVFDRFKRVRGQLHGGRAGCGNDDFDSYGYFHTSWEGGGTPTSRIRDYLDPCGTGTLTIDGFESSKLSTTLVAESNCAGGCTTLETRLPFVLGNGFPAGTALSIASNTAGISPILSAATANGRETVELIIPADAGTATGIYTIVVNATGGTATDDITFTVEFSAALAEAPTLVSPAEGAVSVIPGTRFNWDAVPLALSYDFEVSTSSNFSTILQAISTTMETEAILVGPLAGNTQHFWRVRSINDCGAGDWAVVSFTTADITCSGIDGSNLPAEIIPVGTPEVRVDLEVNNAFQVQSFELSLDIEHSYIGDFQARLRSPEGTEIQLFNAIEEGGCSGENMYVLFADEATQTANDFENDCRNGNSSNRLTFQPAEAFAAFAGEEAGGTWTLILNDDADRDGGAITAFSMLFCNDGGISDTHDFGAGRVLNVFPNPVKGLLTVDATGNWPGGLKAVLFDATGRQLANYRMDNAGWAQWDLGKVPAGIYYLRFNSQGREQTERLVVMP